MESSRRVAKAEALPLAWAALILQRSIESEVENNYGFIKKTSQSEN
jgi:hypothetical protein